MRIISSFKDYYDYVSGHDPDPRKVYHRKQSILSTKDLKEMGIKSQDRMDNRNMYWVYTREKRREYGRVSSIYSINLLLFCDTIIPIVADTVDGGVRYHYDLGTLPYDFTDSYTVITGRYYGWNGRKEAWNDFFGKDAITTLNKDLGCPIIHFTGGEYHLNPRLSDLGFNHVKKPNRCYQDIYNWIPYPEPDLPMGGPDDMIRYESKGFDKKTSFRNVK